MKGLNSKKSLVPVNPTSMNSCQIKHIIFLFLLTSITHLNAQELHFGAKAGLNRSIIMGDTNDADFRPRSSFHLGVFLEMPMKGK